MPTTPPKSKSSSTGGGTGSFLTQKAGPLPVWGWAVVALAGFYLYRKLSGTSTSSTSSTGATGTVATGVPTETLTTPGGSYSGPVGYAPSSVTGSPGSHSPTPGGGSGTTAQFVPLTAAEAHNLQVSDPKSTAYYESAPGIFTAVPITSFTPTSGTGTAYLYAPSGYQAPKGAQAPVSGVVGK